MSTRNNATATRTRGRPFEPGNSGRPKGARNKATLAAEALIDGEAEGLTRKCIELALAGDTTALRLCLERLLPARKSRPITLDLPPIGRAEDVLKAQAEALHAMAAGQITPDEAATVAGVLEQNRRIIETMEIEQRLAALEQKMERKQ